MAAPKSLLKGFEKSVETVRPDPKKRVTVFDEATTGLCLLVTPRGRKTFTLVARGPREGGKPGKQVWREVGGYPDMTVAAARTKAREGLVRLKAGLDPFPPAPESVKPETFNDVADNFLKLHVRKEDQGEAALRSAKSIERQFDVFFRPAWGDKPFSDIKRSDVAKLLRDISAGKFTKIGKDGAQRPAPVMADRALATLSTLVKFQTDFMDDDWQSPTFGVRRKTKASARARDRILADDDTPEHDDELRLLWQAAEGGGTFGAFVRTLLLTGQRRTKVAAMKWSEVAEDGTWSIPSEPGEKGNAGNLKLPKLALDIIRAQPEIKGNPYVFAARANRHVAGYGPLKKKLDAAIRDANDGQDIKAWRLHDLRRTARSLMARARVDSEVAEKVLGHSVPGITKIYNRAALAVAKAEALEKLAALVEQIINPPEGNVVSLTGRGR